MISHPIGFKAGTLSLLQWSKGQKLGSTNYDLISVDNHGQLFAGGNELGVFVDLNDWFNISAHVNYLTGDSYEVAICLDGKLISVCTLDMPLGNREFIRFLGTGTSGFKGSRIDNIQITQTKVNTPSFVDIWDVDFNGFENETVMNNYNWSTACNVYPVVSVSGENKVEDGRLKITSTSPSTVTELSIGGDGCEPILRYGSAAISMKFELSAAGATDVSHNLISWKKIADEASILGFKNNKFVFCGVTVSDEIVAGNEYDLKVEIDGYRKLADLYIDGVKKVSSALILGVDSDISAADSFSDVIAMFASSAEDASVVYYVDDLKIEKVDKASDFDVSFDFTGWSGYSALPLSEKIIGFQSGGSNVPTVVKADDGNEYIIGGGSRRFYLNDANGDLLFKHIALEFDIYYTGGNGANAVNADGTINTSNRKNIIDCNGALNGNSAAGILFADGAGHLIAGSTVIAENISDSWTSIKIEYISDATNSKWTTAKIYVDGVEKYSSSFSKTFTKTWCFRFIPQSIATFGWDNIRFYEVEGETTDFNLDFNGDYTSALDLIGGANYFPAIGSTRTDSTGATVTQAEVLTEGENSFLRLNHNKLTSDQAGYIVAENDKFVGCDKYLIEADFRYTCDVGYGFSVATLISEGFASTFKPVCIKGSVNTLYVSIRGMQYDLYTKSGELIKASTTSDKDFTKVAILVDEENLTYTVYVNEGVAYYYYDGEYLPCVSLPITFESTDFISGANSQMRLFEIAPTMSNDSVLDISRVALKALPSGISSEFKSTQTRVTGDGLFDIRFIAGVDSLYGSNVGFIVETEYEGRLYTKEFKTNLVYSSILEDEKAVSASELGCEYLFVVSIDDLPETAGKVTFKVTSFVEHAGVRIMDEAVNVSAEYSDGNVIVK